MRLLLPAALAVALVAVALVRRPAEADPLAQESFARLVESPLDRSAASPAGERPAFLDALLAHPALSRTDGGLVLRLGRVAADPTPARGSAESAGELLALEAHGPDGPLGVPLWQAILSSPALQREGGGRKLALYGCRHSADPHLAPALEDTYGARVSLADALAGHARAQPGAAPLSLLGKESPVKGGVNFEVKLSNGVQSVEVTIDGKREAKTLTASRSVRFPAPNDARARAALVGALRERARARGLGELSVEGEDEPAAGGVDVRVELFDGRLALVASGAGGPRLATHIDLSGDEREAAPGSGSASEP